MSKAEASVAEHVRHIWLVDTHEHLPDESIRLAFKPLGNQSDWDWVVGGKSHRQDQIASTSCVDDWTFLLSHYVCDDLCSAGLEAGDLHRIWVTEAPAEQKFDVVADYWKRIRHTGFGQSLRLTLRALYGEEDLTRASAPRIAERYAELRRPGFYDHVLRNVARIDHCHVNSFTSSIFHDSERPDLLRQDLDLTRLTDPSEFERISAETTVVPSGLPEWLQYIDEVFEKFGPKSAAVKLKTAYYRSFDFTSCDRRRAEQAFNRYVANFSFLPEDRTDLHDFLLRYCIERSVEYGLPIKIHTGYLAGCNYMPLQRVRHNQGDLCHLYQDYPDAKFVIFHIGYPYHHEVVAVAKHYSNVYVDMCFAWLLDPVESVQFLRSFLVTCPYNKLFAFGGDFYVAELVAGHAELARNGIARALTSLVAESLLAPEEARDLASAIMRENAISIFGSPGDYRAARSAL